MHKIKFYYQAENNSKCKNIVRKKDRSVITPTPTSLRGSVAFRPSPAIYATFRTGFLSTRGLPVNVVEPPPSQKPSLVPFPSKIISAIQTRCRSSRRIR
mmetsp:Transcript_28692/g.59733  ORF Transcript_28692/g.59733 Transcript_28692/m.59733 type:complete len:99 (-) Transcript_28692:94-390(-)